VKPQNRFFYLSISLMLFCAQAVLAFSQEESSAEPNDAGQKLDSAEPEHQGLHNRFAEHRRKRLQQRQMRRLQKNQNDLNSSSNQQIQSPPDQGVLRQDTKLPTSIEKSHDKSAAKEAPCLSWLNPIGKPKAIILCVHGLGLHCGSYEQFGKAMALRGYAVYAVDVRGFGSWMAAKGREKCDFKHCSDDIVSTLNVLHLANPGVPVYLLGESMGGAIALDVASENPALINGLISAVPAAERFKTGQTNLKVFMHLLTGNRKVNVEKSVVNRATADPSLREEWAEDPLARMDLSASELMQFQTFMNENHDRAKKIDKLPVLIVQGGKDKLVKAEGTRELFEKLVTEDKNLAMVNGAEHLVYEEGQFSKEVLDLTDNWISQRLPMKDGQAASPNMMKARAMVQSKQFATVIPLLQRIVFEEPQNPEAYVLLGLAFMRTGHPLKARENVRKAFLMARASKDPEKSRKANDLLLNLPPEMVAPVLARAVRGAMPGSSGSRRMPFAAGLQPGSYKVLIFSAKWCEPCKDLEPIINEARSRFGNKVQFSTVDVDDEKNQALIEKYHVSPVPTMIFLRPDGDIADYSVGFSGVSGMIKGIAKMLLPE
jgi:alpha-beta hydrolase superfamily lysophospholipase/thiol-disulfide isomerase/thioredoxin